VLLSVFVGFLFFGKMKAFINLIGLHLGFVMVFVPKTHAKTYIIQNLQFYKQYAPLGLVSTQISLIKLK